MEKSKTTNPSRFGAWLTENNTLAEVTQVYCYCMVACCRLSIMGHHLDALKPLMDGSSSYLEEEVFEKDGHVDDIIGIDYLSL